MSTLPGPFAIPNDSTTPYKVTFDRLMRALADLQFQADVLAEKPGRRCSLRRHPLLAEHGFCRAFLVNPRGVGHGF